LGGGVNRAGARSQEPVDRRDQIPQQNMLLPPFFFFS
jgi:hypothetical protein